MGVAWSSSPHSCCRTGGLLHFLLCRMGSWQPDCCLTLLSTQAQNPFRAHGLRLGVRDHKGGKEIRGSESHECSPPSVHPTVEIVPNPVTGRCAVAMQFESNMYSQRQVHPGTMFTRSKNDTQQSTFMTVSL